MRATPDPGAAAGEGSAWLNRDVAGMTVTSFLSDAGHEMVTAMLPGFFRSLGLSAAALGWIEGAADAGSSFVKLGAGWISDRVGRRKPIVAAGYFITATALALLAAAVSWPLILLGRVVAWMGRGARSPLRRAMLSEAVTPATRGRAFGLHRAGDTLGAVVGPLAGAWLLSRLPRPTPAAPYHTIFLLALVPGLGAVVAFVWLVRERRHPARPGLRLLQSLRELHGGFRSFVRAAGVFGLGDYSHTLLILAATVLLSPRWGAVRAAQGAALLYVLHNLVYAAGAFPVGALADRVSKAKLLAGGYLLAVITTAGLAVLMARHSASLLGLALVFAGAGAYVAIQDPLESAIPADLLAAPARATGYGAMGAVNGVGDFVASGLVGGLWALSPSAAFGAAAALMLAGAVLVWTGRGQFHAAPA
ncbi:MAG: MFS transporter [Terriglobales bacterium]